MGNCSWADRAGRVRHQRDDAELNRQYTETDETIDNDSDPNEATEDDYQDALRDMVVKL